MKILNLILGYYLFLSCLTATPKLDTAWGLLSTQVEARQRGELTDDAFVSWYREYIKKQFTTDEVSPLVLGLPVELFDLRSNCVKSHVFDGTWQKDLKIKWGDYYDEVSVIWGDYTQRKLNLVKERRCILFTRLASYEPIDQDGLRNIEKYDTIAHQAIGVYNKEWVFIYGDEILIYPKIPSLRKKLYYIW